MCRMHHAGERERGPLALWKFVVSDLEGSASDEGAAQSYNGHDCVGFFFPVRISD